jgi:hypothetical protein
MLPEAISEALGITLSEVLDLYFGEMSEEQQDQLVWDAIDRRRAEEEGEEWLAKEARRHDVVAELVYQGGDDTYQCRKGVGIKGDLMNDFLVDWCP